MMVTMMVHDGDHDGDHIEWGGSLLNSRTMTHSIWP